MKISSIKTNFVNANCRKNNVNKNINFNRKWQEHQSWGVRINSGENGETTAKIFTFPDAKYVQLQVNENTPEEKVFEFQNMGDGVFEGIIPQGEIKEGDRYHFVIQKANNAIVKVKDPYSFYQPTLNGASGVYNHNRFNWTDDDWFKASNTQRISRNANSLNGLTPVEGAIIYEMNIATLTQGGDFKTAKQELSRIKELGFNAIEIMPVENTYSYNWGYDGVDKFAVSNFLGGPDRLKEFIDEAHNVGLNVIMDMVPNHIGPDGAQLAKTGPYTSGSTPWGDAFNYEGQNSRYVRDFIVNAALNWVHNYHCDGLRLDMTKFMNSDTTMQQIAAEMNTHFPDAFLIAEDGRSNVTVRGDEHWRDWWQPHDQRVTLPLNDFETGANESEIVHNQKIDDIQKGKVTLSRLGFDSEWDFHYYHTLTKLAYGEADLDALERAIVESGSRVKYSTSHDETGNLDGTRLVAKYMVPMLKLDKFVVLDDNDMQRAREYVDMKQKEGIDFSLDSALNIVKSQKVQQISMKLAQMVQKSSDEHFLSMRPSTFQKLFLDKLGVSKDAMITPKKVYKSFEQAVKTYRAIEALKYATPGPVMTFQGEENLEMTKFNFFREFESIKDERYLYIQKGYPHGIHAYQQSKIGSIDYSADGKKRMAEFELLISDLNRYKAQNPSLTVGKVVMQDTVKHPQNPTIAIHSVDEKTGNETFVISNFSHLDYPIYHLEFPKGVWAEAINTNDEKYGGNGTCLNDKNVIGYGVVNNKKLRSKIAIPANSTLIFTKVK